MTTDLNQLVEKVESLASEVDDLSHMTDKDELRRSYLQWYSQANILVKSNLPSMSEEFQRLYYAAEQSDGESDAWKYFGIRSFLRTTPDWDRGKEFRSRFLADIEQQRGIILAIPAAASLRAIEVATLVTADLVTGELSEARLLLDHGFVRASGAVSGVALESHLKLLHDQSKLQHQSSDGIVGLATRLRKNEVITLGDEKKCVAMADTRNKCDHKKESEPTADEVLELIDDVERFTKRVQVI